MSKIAVIGSGFAGLSAACYLSAAGHEVHVFEKNALPGGRARQFKTEEGFVFDMGPSWYWMPDVFERFFADFGHQTSDFYTLHRLDPAFDIVFAPGDTMSIPDNFDALCNLFESMEKGAGLKLRKFMQEAQYKYEVGMKKLVYMPGISLAELLDTDLIKGLFRLQVFTSLSAHVRRHFTHPKLIALMEFPVLFLGAMPKEIPALYSLMNYAGLKLGTWYPEGGFGSVVNAFVSIAEKNGVQFHFNANVSRILHSNGKVEGLLVGDTAWNFDGIVGAADYHHIEQNLLAVDKRNYEEGYWNKKTLAPSCLIFYLGLDTKIPSLKHHTLFFDEDLDHHSKEIYKNPQWPSKPLFYVCCPSRTDQGVAPEGDENLFLLMPIAPNLDDNAYLREKYFEIMVDRIKLQTGIDLKPHILYKKSYCVNDFKLDYNAFKGNAYGLANTLSQTANLKPGIRNKHIKNLFYAGHLTVPGPGVPPSIISGKVAAGLLNKQLKTKT